MTLRCSSPRPDGFSLQLELDDAAAVILRIPERGEVRELDITDMAADLAMDGAAFLLLRAHGHQDTPDPDEVTVAEVCLVGTDQARGVLLAPGDIALEPLLDETVLSSDGILAWPELSVCLATAVAGLLTAALSDDPRAANQPDQN